MTPPPRMSSMPAPLAAPLPPPRQPGAPYRVCLVCLGNICRSPMAEIVLRAALTEAGLAEAVVPDSAGTGDWHIGEPMYSRARGALARRGYDGPGPTDPTSPTGPQAHRARQFQASWFAGRDLVLAMDASNLATLRRLSGPADGGRIRLFGEIGGLGERAEIPDPYGGSEADFGYVLDLLAAAAPVIAARLARLLGRPGAPA